MNESNQYMLEITMEATGTEGHRYIKRSFPAKKGALPLSRYGHPYDKYTVTIGEGEQVRDKFGNPFIGNLEVTFGGEKLLVPLHGFATVQKNYSDAVIDPYLKTPSFISAGELFATFYLYIE